MPERKAPRYPVEEPVVATWSNGGTHTAEGKTRDISTAGVFFHADFQPKEGALVELVLKLPTEITGGESVTVVCKGRVVRVEEGDSGKTGVAVEIQSYQVLRDA